MASYASALSLARETKEILRPPQRLTVSQAAEKYVFIDTPGGYKGPWRNDLPYYMVEPADCLTDRAIEAVIFVGPAQSAKTQMIVDNWAAHMIICDPSDMMIVQTAMDTARDFSMRRVDRMISATREISSRLKPGGNSDNTFDKKFRSGAILTLGWPTKNQLAGKAIPKMVLTDYDRMPENVDGEGSAFFLAKKRTTTFLSRGMTAAESSPSKPILDPQWKANEERPHEAPPTKGILGLYNTGDRRRLYGKCPHCKKYFLPAPGIEAVHIPEGKDVVNRARNAGLICTNCGGIIDQSQERAFKKTGVWLKEGQTIDARGRIHGEGLGSVIASFWLPGWFAAFQTWYQIISAYLSALDTFERTSDEEPLKNTINLDQGAAYLPKQLENKRNPHALEQRAEDLEKRIVPDEVRFLLAAVDVQKGYFAVQVEGFGVDLESWVIDRFNLRMSYRNDSEGKSLPLDPAAYIEDWDVLINNVIEKKYTRESGGELPILKIACDSGGEDGVTDNAYKFWRKLKKKGYSALNFARSRFILVKGGSTLNAKLVLKTFPDTTKRKDRKTSARGDVPVYSLNTNLLKDIVANSLDREEVGPTYIHFPDWLDTKYYNELTAETRTEKGWKNLARKRNEPFDLMGYVRALLKLLKADRIDWNAPPIWARDRNNTKNTIVKRKRRRRMLHSGVKP